MILAGSSCIAAEKINKCRHCSGRRPADAASEGRCPRPLAGTTQGVGLLSGKNGVRRRPGGGPGGARVCPAGRALLPCSWPWTPSRPSLTFLHLVAPPPSSFLPLLPRSPSISLPLSSTPKLPGDLGWESRCHTPISRGGVGDGESRTENSPAGLRGFGKGRCELK